MGDDNSLCGSVLSLQLGGNHWGSRSRQRMWLRNGREICHKFGLMDGMGVGMQVAEAVRVLLPEFNEIDGMVATNINRVLDAYAHARIGSHVRTSRSFYDQP